MNALPDLVRLDMDWLRLGEPLPVALHDRAGQLLAPRGMVIRDPRQWRILTERELFVPPQEYAAARRAFLSRLQARLRSDSALSDIAETKLAARDVNVTPKAEDAADEPEPPPLVDAASAVARLQVQVNNTLRSPLAPEFLGRLARDCRDLSRVLEADAEGTLMVMQHDANREVRSYAVKHTLLVAAMCDRAALTMGWPPEVRRPLMQAALTMNISMLNLQDTLQQQTEPPTVSQRQAIEEHPRQSVDLLQRAGVTEPVWLEAVAHHRGTRTSRLEDLPLPLRLARLIHRTDHFYARLSPRTTRQALPAAAAARTAFLDETGQPDEAGSAILKVVGLYPPGTLVGLANEEVAIVLRRGDRPSEPWVASFLSGNGLPLATPRLRDTHSAHVRVKASLPPDVARVRLDLSQLLALRPPRL